MAEGYLFQQNTPVRMRRTNTQYWDNAAKQWKTPSRASYYNGSAWVPFIMSVPEPGTVINCGGGGGRAYYVGRGMFNSSQYIFDPLSELGGSGYDVQDILSSRSDLTFRFRRSDDSSTTRNVDFDFTLFNAEEERPGTSAGGVSAGYPFTLTFPTSSLTNAMRILWIGSSNFNSGHEVWIDRGYSVLF